MVGCAEFAKKLARKKANKYQQKKSSTDKALTRAEQAQLEDNFDDPWLWQKEQDKK